MSDVKARFSPRVQAVFNKAMAAVVGRKFHLHHVERDQKLEPEQVAVLLRGENPYEEKAFTYLEQVEQDASYEAAMSEIKAVLDEEEFAVLESEQDALDEVRFMVQDNAEDDLITALFKNTPPMLMRYDLDFSVNTLWNSTEEKKAEEVARIIEHLKVPADHPVRGELAELLDNAIYGGSLQVIWYGNAFEVARQVMPTQKARLGVEAKPAVITFGVGAKLLVLDQVNGTGYEVELGAELTVPFDSERITTDRDGRAYSWDEIAGLHAPAFAAEVKIELIRKVILPDVTRFEDLFEYVAEWDHDRMSNSGKHYQPSLLPPQQMVAPEVRLGPFMSIRLRGQDSRSLMVIAKPVLVEALTTDYLNFDSLSYQLIGPHANGKILVLVEHLHSNISHSMAYIDVDSLPEPRTV